MRYIGISKPAHYLPKCCKNNGASGTWNHDLSLVRQLLHRLLYRSDAISLAHVVDEARILPPCAIPRGRGACPQNKIIVHMYLIPWDSASDLYLSVITLTTKATLFFKIDCVDSRCLVNVDEEGKPFIERLRDRIARGTSAVLLECWRFFWLSWKYLLQIYKYFL